MTLWIYVTVRFLRETVRKKAHKPVCKQLQENMLPKQVPAEPPDFCFASLRGFVARAGGAAGTFYWDTEEFPIRFSEKTSTVKTVLTISYYK